MFIKLLLVAVFSFIALQAASGSTLEDAKKALQELYDLHANLTQNITELRFALPRTFHEQLAAEVDKAKAEINDQVASILEKVSIIQQNAEEAGVDISYCLRTAKDDLNDFVNAITLNLEMCYGNTVISMNGLLDSTYNKIWEELGTHYACNNMSLAQCSKHETERCFNFVIGSIENSKQQMTKALAVVRADLLNQTPGLNIPCRKMIVQEMDFYPSLIMKFINSCVSSATTSAVWASC